MRCFECERIEKNEDFRSGIHSVWCDAVLSETGKRIGNRTWKVSEKTHRWELVEVSQ